MKNCHKTGPEPPLHTPMHRVRLAWPVARAVRAYSDTALPWYLREAAPPAAAAPTINVPATAPPAVHAFVELLSHKYGLVDLRLFDFAEGLNTPEYAIVATGKSDKHVYKAANELRLHVKQQLALRVSPQMEGFVSNARRNANYRRVMRRARKGPMATESDYGTPANSWIVCNTNVDGIHIHIMTEARRREVDLETLWEAEAPAPEALAPEAPEARAEAPEARVEAPAEAETRAETRAEAVAGAAQAAPARGAPARGGGILSRGLHTAAAPLDLLRIPPPASVDDFRKKYDALVAAHLAQPDVVPYRHVVDTILAKHVWLSLRADAPTIAAERHADLVAVMTLLLDLPEVAPAPGADPRQVADARLDLLGEFVRQLYLFAAARLTPASLASPEVLALLWGQVVAPGGGFIGPGTVDRVMRGQHVDGDCSHHQVLVYRARGIADMLELSGVPTTIEFDELVLFTWGNANLHTMFWAQWLKMLLLYLNLLTAAQLLTRWVRLVVYLLMRQNLKFELTLLTRHLVGESPVRGHLVGAIERAGGRFADREEKRQFQLAIVKIVQDVRRTTHDDAFAGVVEYVTRL